MKKQSSISRDHKLPDNMGFKSDPTSKQNIASVGGEICNTPKADYSVQQGSDSVLVASHYRRTRKAK
jgi:hypothetical protein